LSIKLPDPSKALLIVPLSSLSCNIISTKSPINTTITTTDQPGVYKVCCTPTVQGHIEVNVKVNNEQLNSISTMTPINPYCDGITQLHTAKGVKGPCGLATKHGYVFVVENLDNGLAMMNLAMMNENKKAKIFDKIKFSRPRGIAVTHDNHILVTDDHKIQKISIDGRIVASIGNEGNKPLEFDFPCGITVSSTTGHVYVADRDNHRIQVLDPNLSYSFSFGTKGSGDGEFNHPGFIAVDDEHNIYVTDMNNHRIQKFDSKGNFLAQFKRPNSSSSTVGITTDNNNSLLYVADGCNISIFTVEGHFLKSFKVHDHAHLEGITFDSKGNLYVSDYNNHQLLVF
jgi:DNA-binding beta-propeller fold protein YncE